MSLEFRSDRWFVIYRPSGRYGRKMRVPIPEELAGSPAAARKWHDDFIEEWKQSISLGQDPRPLTGLTVAQLWEEYLPWAEIFLDPLTDVEQILVRRGGMMELGPGEIFFP